MSIDDIFMAVKMSNVDVGARSIEINKVEYFIRGLGFIQDIEDVFLSGQEQVRELLDRAFARR